MYRVSENKTLLIGDFGLAGDIYSSSSHGQAGVRGQGSRVRLPVKWMPPESQRDAVSNEKTDVVCVPCTHIHISEATNEANKVIL